MDYDKIILDLLNRIVTLEDKVSKLEKLNSAAQSDNLDLPAGSKKYRFLSDYLLQSDSPIIKLSHNEIEEILKFKLPDSAATHRAFWANTTSHSIALSWLSVNYSVVEVNLEDRYIVFEKTREFETMKKGRSTATTEENHLRNCKNLDMIALYEKLRTTMFEHFGEVGTGATSYYIHWDVSGAYRTRQFANIYIQKEKIRIETLEPRSKYSIGENVPDTHGYTLNYRTDISSVADIEKVKGIILESYNQIKQLV